MCPPSESGVKLNIEPHSLLSDVCVCVCVAEMCAYVCMRPYLKTSGSGPIRSREMVEISGLDQDLRWKRQGGEIAPRRG